MYGHGNNDEEDRRGREFSMAYLVTERGHLHLRTNKAKLCAAGHRGRMINNIDRMRRAEIEAQGRRRREYGDDDV